MSELAIRDKLLELDSREGHDLKVELLYRKVGNEVLIHLIDSKDDQDLTFPVPPEMAQDAFQHPYPYYDDYVAHQAA